MRVMGVCQKEVLSLHVSLFLLCRCFFIGITLYIYTTSHTKFMYLPLNNLP